MDAQAPAFQSIEQEGSTGFLDWIDDLANQAVESGIGSAPIGLVAPLIAASAPATLAGGVLAGTATAILTNAALEVEAPTQNNPETMLLADQMMSVEPRHSPKLIEWPLLREQTLSFSQTQYYHQSL